MPELTRRQLALVVAGILATLTLAVGIYGLVTGPQRRGGAAPDPRLTIPAGPGGPTTAPERDPGSQSLPQTNDAVVFARAVAASLFDWDTSAGYLPTDYQAPVLAEADPSGEETPALIYDVATYFPTVDQWLDLATMNVRQTLTIESAGVPARWASIAAQAHGELRPGTTAVTVEGARERIGIWDGEPATTSSPVAFTVFVACRPSFERCHLLRLSQLDNPLR